MEHDGTHENNVTASYTLAGMRVNEPYITEKTSGHHIYLLMSNYVYAVKDDLLVTRDC